MRSSPPHTGRALFVLSVRDTEMAETSEKQEVDISLIKPYAKNAKIHSPEQVKKIAASITEFGFLSPVLIDRDYNLIAGHGRVEAAKSLGWKTVPAVFIDGLSEAQRRAYILADNKLGEIAEWDEDLVAEELNALKDLDFDIDLTGFSEDDLFAPEGAEAVSEAGKTDERDPSCQHNAFENQDLQQFDTESFYGMPSMEPTATKGDKLLRFMDWNTVPESERSQYIAHFYYDDYKFIAAWREPEKYLERLREFRAVISPDFSLYTDFPRALQILSCYRRQWCAAYWQYNGIDVIPDVVWGDRDSYDYCFDGLPRGGTVAVSTVGVRNDPLWNGKEDTLFKDGYDEMMKRLEPSTVIIYGDMINGLEGNIIRVPSYYGEHRNNWGKKGKDDGQRNE